MNTPVTLGDLVRNDKLLWVYCCDCGHERDVNPAMVPLSAETPVPEVGKQMKCSSLRLAQDQHQARAVPRWRRSDATVTALTTLIPYRRPNRGVLRSFSPGPSST